MRRHVARGARIGVGAPDAAEPVAALEDHEVVDAAALQLHGGGDASEAASDDCDGYPVSHGSWRVLRLVELGMMAAHVLGDRLADPLLGLLVGEPVAAQQLLLPLQRQAGDRPAHGEALEQHLGAPCPEVLREEAATPTGSCSFATVPAETESRSVRTLPSASV